MTFSRIATFLGYSLIGTLVLTGVGPARALAQPHDSTLDQKSNAGASFRIDGFSAQPE